MSEKKVMLSGNRVSGRLHIGHYFGVLKNYVELQTKYQSYFFIANWHGLTDRHDTSSMKEHSIEMLRDWLAVGIDPEIATVFVQSHVKEHAELALLLGMITPLGWLYRCPTFKDKVKDITEKDSVNFGLLGYPVLMTSDILVYRAHYVPVGEDQLAHLEISREIARRFNSFYGNIFPEPEAVLTKTSKLMGLDNRKMSKSYDNCIYLSDDMDTVKSKIMPMVTDPARIKRTDPGNPEICNVYSYHKAFEQPESILKEIFEGCTNAGIGCVDCKKILLKKMEEFFIPIHEKRKTLSDDYIRQVAEAGSVKARIRADETMRLVNEKMNLII
ncbi:MAG: tryptophan--tRNA ligase [bacterium]|nr:tryptophan--tRNA ligase [bacterium]